MARMLTVNQFSSEAGSSILSRPTKAIIALRDSRQTGSLADVDAGLVRFQP